MRVDFFMRVRAVMSENEDEQVEKGWKGGRDAWLWVDLRRQDCINEGLSKNWGICKLYVNF